MLGNMYVDNASGVKFFRNKNETDEEFNKRIKEGIVKNKAEEVKRLLG